MNKTAKSFLSVLLTLCVLLSVCMPCFAAVSYPDGVTNKSAAESAEKTDKLVENAVSSFKNTTLENLVTTVLFESETLSKLLTGIYSSLAESTDTLSKLGIDISPAGVAKGLGKYPTVQKALLNSAGWSAVNLKGAKWNVYDKYDFASAVASMLAPFNDVLYTVLCGGTYKVGVIRITGSNGYETGLVPMLAALGCTWFESSSTFYAQAEGNKNSMVWNTVISIFSLLEEVLESPAMKLSATLPNLAYYIKDGGLQSSVDALLKPFTPHIGSLVSFFSGSQMLSLLMFLQDSQKYTTNFSENINTVLSDMTESSDLKLAPIDLDTLKGCGTLSGGKVVANIGESFTYTFTWLIDTLKLNSDKVEETLGANEDMATVLPVVQNLLKKETSEIFKMLVTLLTSEKGSEVNYEWTQKEFTATSVSYTANLGEEKYKRVLKGIDGVMNEFAVEFGGGKTLSSTLKGTIYSGTILAKLMKGLYGALGSSELQSVISTLGIYATPSAVSNHLRKSGFYTAASYLSGAYSWEKISEERLASCFKSGSRTYFEEALTAALMPLEPVFEMLFANGTLTVLDSVNIPGSNGYNSAVIPILEALGCPDKHILTYAQYEKCKGSDKIIGAIITPVLDLVDKICKKPVYTLTAILPNMVYFISNGSLMQCLENLLNPILELLKSFGIDIASLGIDLEEIKKTDVLTAVSDMIPDLAKDTIKLSKPDLKSLAGIGSIASATSKRTFDGKREKVYVVKADQTAVLITLLRYVVDAIRAPENSKVVSEMMAPKDGDNSMFSQYSSGIGDQMAEMTTDETIEWLYKLFFRERAVSSTTGVYVYDKEIIYQPEDKKSDAPKVIIPIVIVLLLIAAFLIWRRDRIKILFERKKAEKALKKEAKAEKKEANKEA
ncbi:MAG: hypothetical protein Q4D20_01795 [Clostridia bacterium]|nr:hypothetical protein [Clostridia bacterium]